MPSVDELRAALAAAELEEKLVAAKATKAGASEELKAEVRAARQTYREMRSARPAEPGDARPDTIKAKASVKTPGGK